jgi:hypothetical protein
MANGTVMKVPPQAGRAFLCDEKTWKRQCPNADYKLVRKMAPEVREVRLGVPSPLLQREVVIVDTPGLGAVNKAHGDLTRKYLAECDAALFLMNTDPTMGEREMTFLQYAAGILDKFLFIQTQRDLGERTEHGEVVWKRVVREHAERIREIMGDAPEAIHAVSALQAAVGMRRKTRDLHESGIPALRDALDKFLASHSGADRLGSWLRRASLAHDRVAKHLEEEERRLRVRLSEAEAVVPTRSDLAEWEIISERLSARLHQERQQCLAALSRASDEVEARVAERARSEAAGLGASPKADTSQFARIERSIVRSIQVEAVDRLGAPIRDALAVATRLGRAATQTGSSHIVSRYLLDADPVETVERMGFQIDIASATAAVEERRNKDGFWARVGRGLLIWLFPNIGTEIVTKYRLDPNALAAIARDTARDACTSVRSAADDKLRSFAELVLDELASAAERARAEVEETGRLARRTREECQAELDEIGRQKGRLASVDAMIGQLKQALQAAL